METKPKFHDITPQEAVDLVASLNTEIVQFQFGRAAMPFSLRVTGPGDMAIFYGEALLWKQSNHPESLESVIETVLEWLMIRAKEDSSLAAAAIKLCQI